MAVQIPGTRPRILPGGETGAQRVAGFVNIRTAGARDVVDEFIRLAIAGGIEATPQLAAASVAALRPVMEVYKESISDATGNLRRSVTQRKAKRQYPGIGIGVGGPVHRVEGDEWDVLKKGAGNHAWLYELGTGPRKAGTQGRRTYLNVQQRINGRFRPIANTAKGRLSFDDEEFDALGRGYYFLMGSKNVKGRESGPGAFVKKKGGGTRPYFLRSGDTYPAMPAEHAMEKAINRTQSISLRKLIDEINKKILKLKS